MSEEIVFDCNVGITSIAHQIAQIVYNTWNALGANRFVADSTKRTSERASLIVTSNLEFAKWTSVFLDDQFTVALLDRLTHHCHILEMNGDSYRFRESLKQKAGIKS